MLLTWVSVSCARYRRRREASEGVYGRADSLQTPMLMKHVILSVPGPSFITYCSVVGRNYYSSRRCSLRSQLPIPISPYILAQTMTSRLERPSTLCLASVQAQLECFTQGVLALMQLRTIPKSLQYVFTPSQPALAVTL